MKQDKQELTAEAMEMVKQDAPATGENAQTGKRPAIDENLARAAKKAISFDDYEEGSATAKYNAAVDSAKALAEEQKAKLDPELHGKIDALVERYARKLADWINRYNRNQASVPSVMIVGPGKFPVRKKEQQNEREGRLWKEYDEIKAILNQIQSVSNAALNRISADDPNAIAKLQKLIADEKEEHERMKRVNSWYRNKGTLEGCSDIGAEERAKIESMFARKIIVVPYPHYTLANHNAEIKRLEDRLIGMQRVAATDFPEWVFDGGRAIANKEINRLQILLNDRPSEELKAALKKNAFRWSPREKAWQRQLTGNAFQAMKELTAKYNGRAANGAGQATQEAKEQNERIRENAA